METRNGPVATTAVVDATVALEATEPARDSCCTEKLRVPVWAVEVAEAVTAAPFEDVAFIAVQSLAREAARAAEDRAENLVLRVW